MKKKQLTPDFYIKRATRGVSHLCSSIKYLNNARRLFILANEDTIPEFDEAHTKICTLLETATRTCDALWALIDKYQAVQQQAKENNNQPLLPFSEENA